MLPSEEEKTKILEAQMANPDVPLGNAEQFLLTLSSITELSARLSIWAFKLDYDGMEGVSYTFKFSVLSLLFSSAHSQQLQLKNSKHGIYQVLPVVKIWSFYTVKHTRDRKYWKKHAEAFILQWNDNG